jgi:rhodanese-related sulfurtransferase
MGAFSETDFDLPPERVNEIVAAGEAQLVDVREPYEWEAGRISGARHIELEHLAGRADELDKDEPVIFHCRLGRRSALATDAFRAVGFDAYNMSGGILAWAEAGLPLEPEGGEVAAHGPEQLDEPGGQ